MFEFPLDFSYTCSYGIVMFPLRVTVMIAPGLSTSLDGVCKT